MENSRKCTLYGTLSCNRGLSGQLSVPAKTEHEVFAEDYEVIPNTLEDQVLNTANKVLSKDIVVRKIPYQETGNTSEGTTVYIGMEVV